jgi:hypothetical protein
VLRRNGSHLLAGDQASATGSAGCLSPISVSSFSPSGYSFSTPSSRQNSATSGSWLKTVSDAKEEEADACDCEACQQNNVDTATGNQQTNNHVHGPKLLFKRVCSFSSRHSAEPLARVPSSGRLPPLLVSSSFSGAAGGSAGGSGGESHLSRMRSLRNLQNNEEENEFAN